LIAERAVAHRTRREHSGRIFEVGDLSFIATGAHNVRPSPQASARWRIRITRAFVAMLLCLSIAPAVAQHPSGQPSDGLTAQRTVIEGTVLDATGNAAADALVRLEQKGVAGAVETRTNAAGAFVFSALKAGSYTLSAEKSGLRSRGADVVVSPQGDPTLVRLVLGDAGGGPSHPGTARSSATQAMEFEDKPNFTIAGVTDWTAAGGHGSDSSLRTSEALVRETVTLKPQGGVEHAAGSNSHGSEPNDSEDKLRERLAGAPGDAEANHRLGKLYLLAGRYAEAIPLLKTACTLAPENQEDEFDLALAFKGAGDLAQARQHVRRLLAQGETADFDRLAGELDEALGDPLAAVHEYEQAVRMDPSEQNYFEWGSELLVHRAVWQAQEVLQQGAKAYPKSARMLSALGAALFAGARYDEAAQRFCDASDLNPADPEPYIFMGKIEMAAPNPLTCVEQKLARFVDEQPGNALANYFYAIALWKRQEQSTDEGVAGRVESLLKKAVAIDARCGDAYLQLGILHASQGNYQKAIGFYEKAIEVSPQLADAHYRLGVAYDRLGEPDKARKEFELHDEIKKQQAAVVEQERREVKQFLVVVPGQPAYPPAH
jgi:tetratricopeptide (TPR) repeat protein